MDFLHFTWESIHELVAPMHETPKHRKQTRTLSQRENTSVAASLDVNSSMVEDVTMVSTRHTTRNMNGKAILYRSRDVERKERLRTSASFVAVQTVPGLFGQIKDIMSVVANGVPIVLFRIQTFPMAEKCGHIWKTTTDIIREELFPIAVISEPLVVAIDNKDISILNADQSLMIPPRDHML